MVLNIDTCCFKGGLIYSISIKNNNNNFMGKVQCNTSFFFFFVIIIFVLEGPIDWSCF